jgi:hypothetical protein
MKWKRLILNSGVAAKAAADYGCEILEKNTFIEFEDSESLLKASELRRTKSAPDLGLASLCSLPVYDDASSTASSMATSLNSSRSLNIADNELPLAADNEQWAKLVSPITTQKMVKPSLSRCSTIPSSDDLAAVADTSPIRRGQQHDPEKLPSEMKGKLHENATCVPCMYFQIKADGCRLGDACNFCHICTEEDVKNFRRAQKRKTRKEKLGLPIPSQVPWRAAFAHQAWQ